MNFHLDIGLVRGWALLKKPPQEVVDALSRLAEYSSFIRTEEEVEQRRAPKLTISEIPADEIHDDERSERSLREHISPADRKGQEARRQMGNS